MKATLLLLVCTAGLRAVQLSQLIDPAEATSAGAAKTSFKRTFQPLPAKLASASEGAEGDSKECQWAVDELKKASLDNEGLRGKLSALEKQFAEQENSLIGRLGDLQETYQQLYNKYESLKATLAAPQATEPTVEDCLVKVKSSGWTCTNASPAQAAADPAPTESPAAKEDACKASLAELDEINGKLKSKSEDFDALKCEKEKLDQQNKDLQAKIDGFSCPSLPAEKKDAETSTTDQPSATTDSSPPQAQADKPVDKPAADASQADKPADQPATVTPVAPDQPTASTPSASDVDALQIKLAATAAELSKCLQAKGNFTAFIFDINESLSKCSKAKEDLEGQVKTLKESSAQALSGLKDGVTANDLINRASRPIGGRRY